MTQTISNQTHIDNLIALKSQYEQSLTEANAIAIHYREQLAHINGLLLAQLSTQASTVSAPDQAVTEAPDSLLAQPKLAVLRSIPTEAPSKSTLASTVSLHKAKTKSEPIRRAVRGLLPQYQGLNRLEAIAQVLREKGGQEVSALVDTLFGSLNAEEHKAERKRLNTLLNQGLQRGLWKSRKTKVENTINIATSKQKQILRYYALPGDTTTDPPPLTQNPSKRKRVKS
jgi:hypothetical protein